MLGRLVWMSFALCVGAAVAGAQPLADRAPLGGSVFDEVGKPVASAVLTVRSQEDNGPRAFWGSEARADASGRFLVSGTQEGRYFVNVDAPGYAPLADYAINWKASSAPLRLSLSRLTRLVVRALRADGTPLRNAPVWIRLRMPETSANTKSNILRATTDAQGEAVVPNVTPATYNLIIASQEGVALERDVPVVWKEAGTRLDVRLSRGATLKIKASDTKGQSLGGAVLVVFARTPQESVRLGGQGATAGENWALNVAANSPQAIVTRDGDGTLELPNLPAGLFTARLSLPGYGEVTREIEAQDGQTVEWQAAFPARRAASLELEVRGADGLPLANSLIALRLVPLVADGSFAPDSASPFEGIGGIEANGPTDLPFFVSGPGGRIARTNEGGLLKLFPLKTGRYRVFASRPAPDDWLRSPVPREGIPVDVSVAPDQAKTTPVQVP